MKPSFIGAGTAFVSTALASISYAFNNQIKLLGTWMEISYDFALRSLMFPFRCLYDVLPPLHTGSVAMGVLEILLINTLLGAVLGWLAGRIYRAIQSSRTPASAASVS